MFFALKVKQFVLGKQFLKFILYLLNISWVKQKNSISFFLICRYRQIFAKKQVLLKSHFLFAGLILRFK